MAGPDPAVIVTTAALQALDRDQLAAVLAHERAHLAWHHHRLLALARIARQLLPFLPLMREAAVQVARLVEMHADDTATAAHDTRTLATALVVLAEKAASPRGRPPPGWAPPGRPRPAPTRCSGSSGCSARPSRWAACGGSCCGPGRQASR